MSTIAASQHIAPTRIERLLLIAAHSIERFVHARLEHRAARRERGVVRAQSEADRVRRDATACGGIGLLPR